MRTDIATKNNKIVKIEFSDRSYPWHSKFDLELTLEKAISSGWRDNGKKTMLRVEVNTEEGRSWKPKKTVVSMPKDTYGRRDFQNAGIPKISDVPGLRETIAKMVEDFVATFKPSESTSAVMVSSI